MECVGFRSMLIQTSICKMTFLRWSGNVNIDWVLNGTKDLLVFVFGTTAASWFWKKTSIFSETYTDLSRDELTRYLRFSLRYFSPLPPKNGQSKYGKVSLKLGNRQLMFNLLFSPLWLSLTFFRRQKKNQEKDALGKGFAHGESARDIPAFKLIHEICPSQANLLW